MTAATPPPPPAAGPTLAEQIMPLLVAHCPGIQCKMVGACCHTRCHAVAPLAAAAAEARPLRAFRAAIAAAAVAYHAGRGLVGGMTLPDVAFAQAVQDALDAPQGGAPGHEDAAAALFAATLAYCSAWWAVESEARRLRARGRRATPEELVALGETMIASAQHAALDALHAAYVAWVGDGGGQTQEEGR